MFVVILIICTIYLHAKLGRLVVVVIIIVIIIILLIIIVIIIIIVVIISIVVVVVVLIVIMIMIMIIVIIVITLIVITHLGVRVAQQQLLAQRRGEEDGGQVEQLIARQLHKHLQGVAGNVLFFYVMMTLLPPGAQLLRPGGPGCQRLSVTLLSFSVTLRWYQSAD
ncbi:hypothetical protein T492DRAFT_109804 [Pavlovales sp. CCMP2436]|nr:hypothetical protein T492DRAFT_109804 [Pavlovales sp. CCMP2436]